MLIQDIDSQPALLHSLPYQNTTGHKKPLRILQGGAIGIAQLAAICTYPPQWPAVARPLRRIFSTVLKLLAPAFFRETESFSSRQRAICLQTPFAW